MKSLLVDALRQAKSEQSDRESEDSLVLGETPLEGASNDGDEYVEETSGDALELMQTTTDLVVVDVEVEVDDATDGNTGVGSDADAAFKEAFELAGSGRRTGSATQPRPEPVRHGQPDGFVEHSARWLPLVCILLLIAAMSAIPVWNSLMSDDGGLGLMVGDVAMPAANVEGDSDERPTRFPFAPASAPVRAPNVTPPVAVDPQPERVDVAVIIRERSPVGATDLADDTFSTISALYRAYLGGDVSSAGLAEILDARARRTEPGMESELKLLLQQYPDESILHNALGTLLSAQARWPEARAAFARAADTAEGAR